MVTNTNVFNVVARQVVYVEPYDSNQPLLPHSGNQCRLRGVFIANGKGTT